MKPLPPPAAEAPTVVRAERARVGLRARRSGGERENDYEQRDQRRDELPRPG